MAKKGFIAKYHISDIIGNSLSMHNTLEKAKRLAQTDLSILIRGESGVGKELFASAIHNASNRCKGPYLAINFSALPEELAESELFGYEDGAFTGAKKGGKRGIFEEANGGTIFLDEIGDISPRIQVSLLRVLQEKEIRRVGGTEIIPIDVRIIAATHRDLVKMCQEGQFREDLYHRLRKLYLKIPPLREHLEDLDLLIEYFSKTAHGKQFEFSDEVKQMLYKNPWKGNIRELQNLIDYFQAVCTEETIQVTDFPDDYDDTNSYALTHAREVATSSGPSSPMSEGIEPVLSQYYLNDGEKAVLILVGKATVQGVGIGRTAISDLTKNQPVELSPNQVRQRAKTLEQKGLITLSIGRKGMELTSSGIAYYRALERL